ncbi:MAG: hypothetical protein IBX72_15210 [Nitrospirae bacterium]|nr:hypothetical protein [Nitrospirota bacterium]
MPYLIINYDEPLYEFVELVRDDKGNTLLFDSEEEALEYAEKELNFSWEIVGI